jgi:hypothetical protein
MPRLSDDDVRAALDIALDVAAQAIESVDEPPED